MKTNKLPWSEYSGSQAAGSRSMQGAPPNSEYLARSHYLTPSDRRASNDSSYEQELHELFAEYQRNHHKLVVESSENSQIDSSADEKHSSVDSGAAIINFSYKKPAATAKFQRTSSVASLEPSVIQTMEDIEQIDEKEQRLAARSQQDEDHVETLLFGSDNSAEPNSILDVLEDDDVVAINLLDDEDSFEAAYLQYKQSVESELQDIKNELDANLVQSSKLDDLDSDTGDRIVNNINNDSANFGYKKSAYKKADLAELTDEDDWQPPSFVVPYDTAGSNINAQRLKNHQDWQPVDSISWSAPSINTKKSDAIEAMPTLPERVFMNSLMKHTLIALAIIIPLAAFTAYAATPDLPAQKKMPPQETVSTKPSDILFKSASTPTTVDSVDLSKYSGTWFEVGRLPMPFQKKCAGEVTATYTPKPDGSIEVLNQCQDSDGKLVNAKGQAKPVDDSGSKLKVTFLPSWIRWLPVGRADYWVLARDDRYQTALVGTPNQKYLWLLARSPNISQETYNKYRQIAQQQGYDLKEFTLTSQSMQNVKLVP